MHTGMDFFLSAEEFEGKSASNLEVFLIDMLIKQSGAISDKPLRASGATFEGIERFTSLGAMVGYC